MNEPALCGLRRKLLDLRAKLGLAHPAVGAYGRHAMHPFRKPAVSGVFAGQPS